jgi:hypothetical protein
MTIDLLVRYYASSLHGAFHPVVVPKNILPVCVTNPSLPNHTMSITITWENKEAKINQMAAQLLRLM